MNERKIVLATNHDQTKRLGSLNEEKRKSSQMSNVSNWRTSNFISQIYLVFFWLVLYIVFIDHKKTKKVILVYIFRVCFLKNSKAKKQKDIKSTPSMSSKNKLFICYFPCCTFMNFSFFLWLCFFLKGNSFSPFLSFSAYSSLFFIFIYLSLMFFGHVRFQALSITPTFPIKIK